MISHDIFVSHLTDGKDLSVDWVLFDVLVQTQMNPYLFDGIHALIKHVLRLEDTTKSALTKLFFL